MLSANQHLPSVRHRYHSANEQIIRQSDSTMLDALGASRTNSGARELPDRVAIYVNAGLFKSKNVVRLELIAFHSGYLGNASDLSVAAGQARRLHDQLHSAGNLL